MITLRSARMSLIDRFASWRTRSFFLFHYVAIDKIQAMMLFLKVEVNMNSFWLALKLNKLELVLLAIGVIFALTWGIWFAITFYLIAQCAIIASMLINATFKKNRKSS